LARKQKIYTFTIENRITDWSVFMELNLLKHDGQSESVTACEIAGQPKLWLDTFKCIRREKNSILSFLEKVYVHKTLTVILAGAGTSAYIGEAAEAPFQKNTGYSTSAIATTNLVSHPNLYFQKEKPTLLISFARSGNSPESLASISLADLICDDVFHLIITCNPSGKLARAPTKQNRFVFFLPLKAHDKGLAMTGSYTSMLLTALLISRLNELEKLRHQVEKLAMYCENILNNYTGSLKQVAEVDFKRAVFLGSGPLSGTAKEAQLKLQELTDGQIICKHDSFLGFRHGPKAVIDEHTLIVYLFSNVDYVQQYELDVLSEIGNGDKGIYSIAVLEQPNPQFKVDLGIQLSENSDKIEEEFLAICGVVPAQILGYFKSLQLGLDPDKPSVNDTISRVVKGVKIYEYREKG